MSSDPGPQPVRIPADSTVLDGDLTLTPHGESIVLFAHGSGSSRHSPRNRYVAAALNARGYGTLLMDLLTTEEEQVDLRTREMRFDIGRLAERLTAAVDWLDSHSATATLPIYAYGASTGAAAALITAADRPMRVRGVISRGGRPDLAGETLHRVKSPVLLIPAEPTRSCAESTPTRPTRCARPATTSTKSSCPRPPTCSRNPARSTPSSTPPSTTCTAGRRAPRSSRTVGWSQQRTAAGTQPAGAGPARKPH